MILKRLQGRFVGQRVYARAVKYYRLYDERGTKALVPSMMYVWNDVEKNNGAPPQNIMDKTFSKETRHAFCEHVRAISVAPFYGYDWNKYGKACSECVKASASGTSLSSTLRCMGWS